MHAPGDRSPLAAPAGWLAVGRGAAALMRDATLRTTALGLFIFSLLVALLYAVIQPAAVMALVFPAGFATGAWMARRLSGDRIELGLTPLGAFGTGAGVFVLAATTAPWTLALAFAITGIVAAFFALPLLALIGQRPALDERRAVLGTGVALMAAGVLTGVAIAAWLADVGVARPGALRLTGILTTAGAFVTLAKVPGFFLRFILWLLTHTVYRITIVGRPNIPNRGPALIIANHVSMIDGALVGACVHRFVRFLVWGPHFRLPVINWILGRLHAIPVTAGNKEEVAAAVERAHRELQAGHVVCIFAEGSVSRTGNLLPFRRGFERIIEGLDVPVIPVYLDRIWGSIFSFKREKFFWKRPERLPYPVTIAFGKPMRSPVTALEARQAIMELGSETLAHRRRPTDLLHTAFLRSAKRRFHRLAMADSTGQRLTYGRLLAGVMLLAPRIARRTEGQEMVGLLLPASVGGAVANIAVLAAGRIPVNLNFTVGPNALAAAVREARISTILTSARFLEKAGLERQPSMVLLEDLRGEIGAPARLRALLSARFVPRAMLARRWRHGRRADSTAAVIFSSGSTGEPKGVLLTHASILANVDAIEQVFPMSPADCFIGVLPFFHSFGLTGTLWFPLLQGASVAYHPNPMDAKAIGELAETYRATMLITTPTFCQSYLRRITRAQFAHLKYAIVGAEKLRDPVARAFETQYGLPLLEGYGCTEMSPVVAVNRPNVELGKYSQTGSKRGSVGHPLPGVSAKIVDRETGGGPLIGHDGLLLVKGPNLMAGYLNHPERTAEVVRDGWYVTGDVAMMDEDGFIFITDRLSRFSKIGGEMVPHLKVEEAINAILGEPCCVVTAVPDESRGERLVAFYAKAGVSPEALWATLTDSDLPRLWLPRKDALIPIEAIPTLGTGKIDLRAVKELAVRKQP